MMNNRSAGVFLSKVNDFLQELEKKPLVKERITEQTQIVDLFRFWYMDCREQEMLKEVEDRENDDPFNLGDMLGGD